MRRRHPLRYALGAVFAAFVAAASVSAMPNANAQTSGAVTVDAVDATGAKSITIDYSTELKPGKSDTYAFDGEDPKPLASKSAPTVPVMFVLDTSEQTANRKVQIFKDQVAALKPGSGGVSSVGVVSTGGGAATPVELSTDAESIQSDLQPVAVARGEDNAIFDSIVLAAKHLAETETAGEIVVIMDSEDAGSGADAGAVRRALRESRAQLHVIDVSPSTATSADLQGIVSELGGTYSLTAEAKIDAATKAVASDLAHSYRAEIPQVTGTARRNLTLTVGGQATTVSFQPQSAVYTKAELAPITAESSSWTSALASSTVLWAVAALAVLAAGGLAWAALNLTVRDNDSVRARIQAYELMGDPVETDPDSALGSSELLKRAVAISGDFAQKRGMAERIEMNLEMADLKLHAGEVVFLMAAAPVGMALLGYALFSNVMIALVLAVIGVFIPNLFIRFRARRRIAKFDAQLPDALQLLAGTLRAGFSIAQAITAVADDVEDPMGQELRRAVAEMQLGRQLEDSLEGAAERLGSKDFKWTVLAIRIQREVGGNLAELLTTVADTMVQRQRLLRDVRALTAEGRASAWVLGSLPIGLIGFMAMANPGYLDPLTTGIGLYIAIGSAVLMVGGFFWMNKIITIEV